MANILKTFLKYSIPGVLDDVGTAVFGSGVSMVSGFGAGIMGKSLSLTNVGMLGKATKTMGYGVGIAGVAVAKPVLKAGAKITMNTGDDILNWASKSRKVGAGVRDTLLKKPGPNSTGINSLLGYEARNGAPWVLAAGAVGLGVAKGADNYDYNLGLRTAVNGVMDTQGVAVTPGSVNPSYTPLYQKSKKVKNFGATGDLTLALHNQRRC